MLLSALPLCGCKKDSYNYNVGGIEDVYYKLFHSKNKGWSSDVSHAIRQKLHGLKIDQRLWWVLPSRLNKFESISK